MKIQTRAALVSTGLNVLLTTFKFILFSISGSLAILGEAWHSLSDIATSVMVLIAVTRKPAETSSVQTGEKQDVLKRFNFEYIAALTIGFFLTLMGILLLIKVIMIPRNPIDRPLMSGIFFLMFSVGSYFIYQYESSIGRLTGSIGLVSDSLHAKTDMLASLLTGISLLLYIIGIDIDRPLAVLIALFIIMYGLDTCVNTVVSVVRNRPEKFLEWRSMAFLAAVTDKSKLKQAAMWCESRSGAPVIAFLGNSRKYLKIALRLSIVTAAVIYCGTCVFTVGPSERAFIERFGRPLQQYDSLGPGLHLKLPWPVDRVIKINSLQSRQLFVGNVVNEKTFALLWTMEHGIEEEFLSGDNHFFFPYLTIQYHVSSVTDYHIHCVDPEQILDAVAHSHITRAFAGMSFESIVGEGRNAIETGLKFSIQKDIDELNAGIEIHGIYIRDIHPPVSIADAFEQVIAARQQKEQMINQAHGYRNQIIPEKRGEFDQKVERARAQSEQLVLIAGGDSGRFLLRCMPDPQSETLTRQRLYFDTMNCVLKSSQNMIVDPALDQTALIIDPSMKNLVLGNETAAQKPASKPVEIGNTAVQVSPETDTMGYYEREEY